MKREDLLKQLGSRIRELRIEKKLTQVALAHICNKDAQSLERVENGKTNPSYLHLCCIAKSLDVELKEIVDFTPPPLLTRTSCFSNYYVV